MTSKKARVPSNVKELSMRQLTELESIKSDFAVLVRRAYAAGIGAAWIQVALWHATERVDAQIDTREAQRKALEGC